MSMKDADTKLLAAVTGSLFGIILQRAGASNYDKLTGMLGFSDTHLLKMMITAIGTASVGIYALSLKGIEHFTIKPFKILMMTVGGLLFGTGFALNGYCPGTGIVAAVEGKKDALIAMIGGILGSIVYVFLKPSIDKQLSKPDYGKITVDGIIKQDKMITALIFGASMILLAYFIDLAERSIKK
ncbi:hypothetical protein CUJ83_00320 [Methanocella sp. CWC-04]|uniref:Sulphur transport domain-containing protein n=1 Tax=Methanooceanicella nereidis TaxID=2052831 RepID=A0AAP2W4M9_9EURY|nr:DUF6691 family protein [Methanocella sp. CWC-04]MCD1293442.1 hypothetical protein [Methanocella sp. CWC-04]